MYDKKRFKCYDKGNSLLDLWDEIKLNSMTKNGWCRCIYTDKIVIK